MQVEKIHDIRTHLEGGGMEGPKRIGVVNMRATRILAFLVISLALIGCAIVGVLAIWEIVTPDYAWRALGSLGIISAAVAIFVALNEGFGPVLRN